MGSRSDDDCPSHLQSQSSIGDLGGGGGGGGCLELVGRGEVSLHFGANLCVCACVCGSAHGSACVVGGGSATAALLKRGALKHRVLLNAPMNPSATVLQEIH